MAVGNKVGQQRSLVDKITKFLRDARAELRKVTWPNRKELTTYTIVVIAITIIVSLFVGVADWLFSQIFGLLAALGR